ncbi:hypothetical protein CF121_08265 [Aeromonas media]|nr:hypothetical protein CF121_08265 [Aeromonas media]
MLIVVSKCYAINIFFCHTVASMTRQKKVVFYFVWIKIHIIYGAIDVTSTSGKLKEIFFTIFI